MNALPIATRQIFLIYMIVLYILFRGQPCMSWLDCKTDFFLVVAQIAACKAPKAWILTRSMRASSARASHATLHFHTRSRHFVRRLRAFV